MHGLRKNVIIILLLFFLVSVTPAQEVIETFTLGNIVECLTYINSGDHEGKFAVIDGWWVYSLDLETQTYKKLFSCKELGFNIQPRGISYISTGDYEGNFLLTDPTKATTLFIVSYSGSLIAEVSAVNFSWDAHSEDITEITSGPFQGNFAMSGFTRPGFVPHIFIFNLVNEGGVAKAYLIKDIQNEQIGRWPLGLTFLPEDYPNPAFRNRLIIADLYADSGASNLYFRVIDYQGNMVGSYPADDMFEGFAYISNGVNQGKFIVSDFNVKKSRIQNIDGTMQEDLKEVMTIGFGFSFSWMLSWLDDTNEFRINETVAGSDNIRNISRNAQGDWSIKDQRYSHNMNYAMDTTKLTNDGKYYLLGFNIVGNSREYMVQRLNNNFQLEETYSLNIDYPGKRFTRICYIPGLNSSEDRFALIQSSENNIYFFDKNFNNPSEIKYYSDGLTGNSDIEYDSAISRYYVLDASNIVHIYNNNWEQITQCDISHLVSRSFTGMTKITSGDLIGNIALLNRTENQLFIINITPELITAEADLLITDIENSGIQNGIINSLTKKLENFIDKINLGKIDTAINLIGAFKNAVRAQSGKKIPEELAEEWLEIAEILINDIKK